MISWIIPFRSCLSFNLTSKICLILLGVTGEAYNFFPPRQVFFNFLRIFNTTGVRILEHVLESFAKLIDGANRETPFTPFLGPIGTVSLIIF